MKTASNVPAFAEHPAVAFFNVEDGDSPVDGVSCGVEDARSFA